MARAYLVVLLVGLMIGYCGAANMLQNPSFEDADENGNLLYWTSYGNGLMQFEGLFPGWSVGGASWYIAPRTGDYSAAGIKPEEPTYPVTGGAYQVVTGLTPGLEYHIKIWSRTVAYDDDYYDGDAKVRVGVDTFGGVDPNMVYTWSGWMYNMTGTAGTDYDRWIVAFLNFTADSDTATVFLDYVLANDHRVLGVIIEDAELDEGAIDVPIWVWPYADSGLGWGRLRWDSQAHTYALDITWGTFVNVMVDEWGNQTCVFESVATSYNEANWGLSPDDLSMGTTVSTVTAQAKNTAWSEQNWSAEPTGFLPDTLHYIRMYSEEPGYYPGEDIEPAKMPTNIKNVEVFTTVTTATISWQTDNCSDEVVEYAKLYWGEDPSCPNVVDASCSEPWEFSAEITGLSEGTEYYYRIVVKFEGHTEAVRGPESFTTISAKLQPTLVNGDFAEPYEGTTDLGTWNPVGWYHIYEGLDGICNYTWEPNPATPSGNTNNQTHITSWYHGDALLCQLFEVQPQSTYRVRRWVKVFNGRARSQQLYDIATTMFVDPDGEYLPGSNSQQAAEWWYWDWSTTGVWRNDDPWYWDHLIWTSGSAGKSSIFSKTKVPWSSAEWYYAAHTDFALFGESTPASLNEGWNLISVPVEPVGLFTADDYGEGGIIPEGLPGAGNTVEDEDGDDVPDNEASEVFADLIAAGNYIEGNLYRYTPGTGYEAYPTQFTTIEAGRAYWLRLDYPAACSVVGMHLGTKQEIELTEGWNMIGCKMSAPVLLADVLVSDGSTTLTIDEAVAAGWLQVPFYYYSDGYKTVSYDGTGQDEYLRPWYGYWVLAFQDVTLILPMPVVQ